LKNNINKISKAHRKAQEKLQKQSDKNIDKVSSAHQKEKAKLQKQLKKKGDNIQKELATNHQL